MEESNFGYEMACSHGDARSGARSGCSGRAKQTNEHGRASFFGDGVEVVKKTWVEGLPE